MSRVLATGLVSAEQLAQCQEILGQQAEDRRLLELMISSKFLTSWQAAQVEGGRERGLTGRVPFPRGTAVQKIVAHRELEPESISDLNSDVPLLLADLIMKRMLAKRPEERFHTPGELATELKMFVSDEMRRTDLSLLSALIEEEQNAQARSIQGAAEPRRQRIKTPASRHRTAPSLETSSKPANRLRWAAITVPLAVLTVLLFGWIFRPRLPTAEPETWSPSRVGAEATKDPPPDSASFQETRSDTTSKVGSSASPSTLAEASEAPVARPEPTTQVTLATELKDSQPSQRSLAISTKSDVLTVGTDTAGAVASLHDALDRIAKGGEIRLLPGNYSEQLVLGPDHEAITLRATEPGKTTIKSPERTLIRITNVRGIKLVNLVLRGSDKTECLIQAERAAGLEIIGNELLAFTKVGIDLKADDGTPEMGYRVVENVIQSGVKEAEAHGIRLIGNLEGDASRWLPARGVQIAGNKIRKLGGSAVLLEGPIQDVEVKENVIWEVRAGVFHDLSVGKPEQIERAEAVIDDIYVVNNSLFKLQFGVRFSGPPVGKKGASKKIFYQNNLIIAAESGGFAVHPYDRSMGKEEEYRRAYHVMGNCLAGVGNLNRAGVLPATGNVTENPKIGSLDPAQEAIFLRYDESSPIAKRAVKADYAKPFIGAYAPYSVEEARQHARAMKLSP